MNLSLMSNRERRMDKVTLMKTKVSSFNFIIKRIPCVIHFKVKKNCVEIIMDQMLNKQILNIKMLNCAKVD